MNLRQVVATAAAGMALVGVGASAQAAVPWVNWSTESAPLGKTNGEGVDRTTVWTWGDWQVKYTAQGTVSQASPRIKVTNTSSYPGFTQMTTQTNAGICIAPEYTNCSQQYYDYDSVDSPSVKTNYYQIKYTTTGLSTGGNYARAYFRAKIAWPLRPDPASGPAFTKGGKSY